MFSKTSVFTRLAWYQIPVDGILQSLFCFLVEFIMLWDFILMEMIEYDHKIQDTDT
jgi:hypothetical protein